MPAPTNTDATTAIDLGTLPASVSQNVHDAGTTYTVWYKFTAPAGSVVIGAFGFGDLVTYRPTIRPHDGPAAAPVQILSIAGQNIPIQFPVTAGTEYFLKFTTNGGNPTPAVLLIEVEAKSQDTAAAGSIIVPDDTDGFPAAVIDPATGDVLRFIHPFPAGEAGDVLTNGSFLVNETGTDDVSLYNNQFVLQATVTPIASLLTRSFVRLSPTLQTFYVGTGNSGGAGKITTVSSAGVLGGTTWTLPATGMTALAPNNDGSIVYVSGQTASVNTPVKRWLTGTSAFSVTDLIAGQGANTSVQDILVLADDTVVVAWRHSGTSALTVKHLDTAGATLNTYTTTSNSNGARLAYDNADYGTLIWLWTHASGGVSTFHKITVSTMVAASTITAQEFESGSFDGTATATPSDRFGHSFSCPFLMSRASVSDTPPPPTRTTPVVTPPGDCPCPSPDGPSGIGAPPTGTGTIGGGGSGKSGTNEGGDGWTPQCDGGGTVGSYATASAGESMVGVREPRIWAEIAFDVASAYWAQDVTIPDPPAEYGGRKSGRVLGISKISRSLSDDNGNYSGAKVTVKLNDKDRAALRTRLGSSTGKYVWEREGIIRIASETNRRTGYATPPRELFRGMTRDVELAADFNASLTFEDRVCSQFGQFGPDRSFSSRLLTLGLYPGCPREIVGKPQQWIFGEVSDAGAINTGTGSLSPKGLVPIWLVGAADTVEDEYHLAAHAVKSLELYGSDGLTPPSRVLLTEGADYRVDLVEVVDSETGETHRNTNIYVTTGTTPTEDHKNGRLTMAANVCGVEDVGDGSGDLITDLFSIYQFIFEHLILPETEYLTGTYPGSPQWADGRYMVHSDSFAAAQAYSAQRIGGSGYQGGFVLGGPSGGAVTLRDLLKRMSNSGDCWFGWSHGGQLKVTLLDDTASLSTATNYKEPKDLRAWPTPVFERDEVENPVLYAYDWDDDKRKFRVSQESVINQVAIGRMGRPKPSPSPIQMRCIRDATTARDVAQRRLLRRKYPPAYYPVVLPIDGCDVEPGDLITITSQEGVGTGSDERALFVRDWTFDPKTNRTTLYCRDLTDILESNLLVAEADPDVWLLQEESDPDVLLLR